MRTYDEELDRMSFLMNYKNSINENKTNNNIEFHTTGADGKIYGIIKEGTKYYVKVTTPGNANLCETYDYMTGFNRKNQCEFKSYNDATKFLETKLISLNEDFASHKDTTIANINKTKDAFAILTEEARKEINRAQEIFENSNFIGKTYDKESKGKAETPAKEGEPFTIATKPELDKDFKETEKNPEKANDELTTVKVSNEELQSTKNKKGGKQLNDFEKAKCDLDGKCVAIKESFEDDDYYEMNDDDFDFLRSLKKGKGAKDAEKLATQTIDDEQKELDTVYPDEDVEIEDDFEDEEWDDDDEPVGLDESVEKQINRITESVFKALKLNEDTTELHVFGKHPRYRKQPMSTPANNEVIVNDGDKDWNDDSVKNTNGFGVKKGSNAPYDAEAISQYVFEDVMNKLGLKKK